MEPERWRRLRSLYERALERSPAEREAFLTAECGADRELFDEARGMLASNDAMATSDARPFLEPLPPELLGRRDDWAPGTRIGSFELAAPLASGGMGDVWEAWQAEPRRRVALKLLHADLNDEAAVRRFRFEAELLARLHHPGIAPIHEAGVHRSADGRETPYLAMEFVDGARDVLTYAREQDLDLRSRLDLMLSVLAAVQHGHQQGVVHRDLKPQNVLVDADGRARVIDFGIARAVGEGPRALAAPDTQLTGAGEILGTLGYMSPEQFSGDSRSVDTRSDVYSLGVVLHELVCDRPPFDLRGRSLFEISRIVRERPAQLPRELQTDLGWIVLKALEKEPDDRYASASELAADLERFLADAPVEAGAPSNSYRLKKFVRRNRVAVLFSSVAALALIAGSAAAFVGLIEARRAQVELARERDAARAAATKFSSISDVLGGLFLSVTPDQDGRDVRVADLLDRAARSLDDVADPDVEAALRHVVGRAYRNLGLLPEALGELEEGRALLASMPERSAGLAAELGAELVTAWTAAGRSNEALALARASLDDARAALGDGDPRVFALVAALGDALLAAGRPDAAVARVEGASAEAAARLGDAHGVTLDLLTIRGRGLAALERHDEARDVLVEAAARAERSLGAEAARTLEARYLAAAQWKPLEADEGLAELEALVGPFERTFGTETAKSCKLLARIADLMTIAGRDEEAFTLLESALPCLETTVAPASDDLITARANLAILLDRLGDDTGALSVRTAAFEAARRWFGPNDPRTLHHELGVAVQLEKEGDPERSLELAEHVADERRATLGDNDPDTLEAREVQGNALLALGRYDEALAIHRDVFERLTRIQGPETLWTLRLQNSLTSLLSYTGQAAEALAEGERMLAAHRRAVPESDASRVILLTNLGLYASDMGQLVLAQDYLRQAHELAQRHLPEDDFDRLQAPLMLANVLRMRGKPAEALSHLHEAADALKRQPGSHLELRIRAHGGLGLTLAALGRTDEARAELETAVGIAEQAGEVDLLGQLQRSIEAMPD